LITVEVREDENKEFEKLMFRLTKKGYIEFHSNSQYLDTMSDLGIMEDVDHLQETVKHLLSKWKVEYKNMFKFNVFKYNNGEFQLLSLQ